MALKQALAVTNTVASTEPCSLYELKGVWSGAAVAYLQIYDAKALPNEGAAPKISIALPAASAFSITFQSPIKLDRGCVIGFSSTNATKTVATGAGNTGNIFAVTDYAAATALTTESSADGTVSVTNSEPIILKSIKAGAEASAVDCEVKLYTKASPAEGDSPIWEGTVKGNQSRTWSFGDGIVVGAEFCIVSSETVTITATYKVTGS